MRSAEAANNGNQPLRRCRPALAVAAQWRGEVAQGDSLMGPAGCRYSERDGQGRAAAYGFRAACCGAVRGRVEPNERRASAGKSRRRRICAATRARAGCVAFLAWEWMRCCGGVVLDRRGRSRLARRRSPATAHATRMSLTGTV